MKIAVVSTGGTIAMAQGRGDKLSSLALDAGDFAGELPPNVVGEVSSIVFSKLPSSNFDSAYARRLAGRIQELVDEVDGIIVTHGTDTMEETAFYVDMVIETNKPIVFTGAMMTATQPGYDGLANLRDAITVARAPETRGQGTLIVFNRDIHSAIHATKIDSERPNAFGSLNTGKLGSVCGERVYCYYRPLKHIKLSNRVSGRVALLKMHYDVDQELVEYAMRKFDVVVIESYGSGRIPPKILSAIDNSNAIIVITTRVFRGHLYDEYSYEGSYQYFRERRVILSVLSSIKSCLLASLCLGNGKDYEAMKAIMEDFWLGLV